MIIIFKINKVISLPFFGFIVANKREIIGKIINSPEIIKLILNININIPSEKLRKSEKFILLR